MVKIEQFVSIMHTEERRKKQAQAYYERQKAYKEKLKNGEKQ